MTSNSNFIPAAAKIDGSRAELARLLLGDAEKSQGALLNFPRSRVLQVLTSKSGVVLLAVAAGGLMLLRPTIAARAIRLVPMGAVLRFLATRLLRNA